MNRSKRLPVIAVSAVLFIFLIYFVQTISQGKELFMREGCSGCHSFKGHGGTLGPDLTTLGERRSTLWVMEQIRAPRSHNPDSRMPEFGHISILERYAITLFLRD
jgi:cbb3-type cytochrome oxidase cytochrome c subunit